MVSRATLLDLLITARDRYQTVRAVCLSQADAQRDIDAVREWQGQISGGPPFGLFIPEARDRAQPIQQTRERAWLQWQPDRLHLEQSSAALIRGQPSGRYSTTFIFDDGWWRMSQGNTFIANHQPETRDRISVSFGSRLLNCLDPAPMVPALAYGETTETEFLGRSSYHVQAAHRPAPIPLRFPEDHLLEGPPGFPAADRFEMIVDAERGVILRFAAFAADEEYGFWDIEEIAFDEPLPDDLFTGVGPPR